MAIVEEGRKFKVESQESKKDLEPAFVACS
jgi:hypothetical protein